MLRLTLIHVILIVVVVIIVVPAVAQVGPAMRSPPPDYVLDPPRVDFKMAIVMILLITVFFVLGFLSVYTRQCAQERYRARLELLGLDHDPAGPDRAHQNRGLEPDIIDTFPAFAYSAVKGLKIGKGSLECAVCLSEFEDSETLRLIPKCDHVFHRECIDAWLVSSSTCPVCRANLVPKPGDQALLAHFLIPIQPEPEPNRNEPESNLIEPGRPPRSMSTGFGPGWTGSAGEVVPRSRSVGHLPVRPGESLERFTLRLPGDVRSQLVGTTAAAPTLPRVESTRRGFRNGSVRRKDGSVYERFEPEVGPEARWVFSAVPPFVSRSGSTTTGRGEMVDRHGAGGSSSSDENIGERSFEALRPKDRV